MGYWFTHGYRTATEAANALEESFARGLVSEGERPEVRHYMAKNRNTGKPVSRYGIYING